MDDNSVYRDLFFEESDDHLQQLNDNVLELESEPDNMDLVNEIFRSAHTLKGMAATMGYDVMTKLTHKMENMFDFFKSGKLKVNSDYISLIFKCLDRLSQLIEDLRDEKELSNQQIEDLLAELEKVESSVTGKKTTAASQTSTAQSPLTSVQEQLEEADLDVIQKAAAEGYHAYSIAIRLDAGTLLKGPRVFLIMEKLEQEGDVIHTEPSVDLLENGDFETDFKLVFLTKDNLDEVKQNIEGNSELAAFCAEEFAEQKHYGAAVKSQLQAAKPQPQTQPAAKPVAKAQPKPVQKPRKKGEKPAHNNARNQSIRVNLTRLDRFLNLVSELVVYRNQLDDASKRNSEEEVKDSLEQVSRLTSELQELVLKIRMQQVSVVFTRFPRMVRDLARDLGKEMELVIEGEETELDKTVVSELSEPLIHLLRNSADHGIEQPDVREQMGKPRKGTIKLSAYQEGNRVNITLEDDGKGLDPQVMKESAESKGIDTTGMSDDELIHLIFHPGFSTAKKVTNISGRGVGLDAVMAKIGELGGSLEMKTELHVGTKFIIKLPLTLSIIQALMVKIGAEVFAVPLDVVERVVMINDEKDLIKTSDQEVYRFQEELIPVIRTAHLLQIPDTASTKKFAIIVKSDHSYHAVLVSELIGQQEIVIKKLDAALQKLQKYQGATIIGNGAVALILDINSICQGKKESQK
ncbi:chemotaxis protein CheW [Liquorilactobacillus satsumensis]|uniref:chemotaxis protein CheW n=1 Tax=Liquorilactobacillus satsumensis TaxID=259059 RepID=UPI0039E9ABBB